MRNDFGLREGMTVFSSDNQRLGKIVAVSDEQFQVEKGVIFPKEYIAGFEEVREVRGEAVYLLHGKDSLTRPGAAWTSRSWKQDRFTETAGDQSIGDLGRARMARTHDVIGAQRSSVPSVHPPLEPMDTVNLAGPPEAIGRDLGMRQFSPAEPPRAAIEAEDEPERVAKEESERRTAMTTPDQDPFKRS